MAGEDTPSPVEPGLAICARRAAHLAAIWLALEQELEDIDAALRERPLLP
jgi:hypothetical protein